MTAIFSNQVRGWRIVRKRVVFPRPIFSGRFLQTNKHTNIHSYILLCK